MTVVKIINSVTDDLPDSGGSQTITTTLDSSLVYVNQRTFTENKNAQAEINDSILQALDGYTSSAGFVPTVTFEENKLAQGEINNHILVSLDGYASKVTESEHYTQLGQAVQDILSVIDGYSVDPEFSGLNNTVEENKNAQNQINQSILQALDGYASDTTVSEHYRQFGQAIQDIVSTIDGYSTDTEFAGLTNTELEHTQQQNQINQSILQALDGYSVNSTESEHYAQQSEINNTIIASLDGYAQNSTVSENISAQNQINQTVIQALDGYVPYVGATADVNLGNHSLRATGSTAYSDGLVGIGGSSSGQGVDAYGTGDGYGLYAVGGPSVLPGAIQGAEGSGIYAAGGGDGSPGIYAVNGGQNGYAGRFIGRGGSGSGVYGEGSRDGSGNGLVGVGGLNGGAGISAQGMAQNTTGITSSGGPNGFGGEFFGGLDNGGGIYAESYGAGNAIEVNSYDSGVAIMATANTGLAGNFQGSVLINGDLSVAGALNNEDLSETLDAILDSLDGYGGGLTSQQGADGYIAFFTGQNHIEGDNDLYWDRVTNQLRVDGYVYPTTDNLHDLGKPTNRWHELWLGPGSIHLRQAGSENDLGTEREWNVGLNELGSLVIRQGNETFLKLSHDAVHSISLGYNASVFEGFDGIAIGSNALVASGNFSIAIGNNATAGTYFTSNSAISIGNGVQTPDTGGISIGDGAGSTGQHSVSLGSGAFADEDCISIGRSANCRNGFPGNIAIGADTDTSVFTDVLLIGNNIDAIENNYGQIGSSARPISLNIYSYLKIGVDGYLGTQGGDLFLNPAGGNVVPGTTTIGIGTQSNRFEDGYFVDLNTVSVVSGITTIESVNSPYVARKDDYTILADTTGGEVNITLPGAVGNKGRIYNIKKLTGGINNVVITASGTELIDGGTITLSVQYQSRTIQCDGFNWWITGGIL